jgi:hypothetical protein
MFLNKPYFFHQTLVERVTGENQPYYLIKNEKKCRHIQFH